MEQDIGRFEIKKMKEYTDLRGKAVLEVGCGDGRVSAMLAPLVKSLAAIDPDQERLALAKKRVGGVDFRIGRGEELPFPAETFDIVAFTFSLHHMDSVKALAEAHCVLKPSGHVLIVEPSVEGEMHRFFRTFRNEDAQIAEALQAIRSSGFTCAKSGTFDIDWLFDDAEEVYSHFFIHNRMASDDILTLKMKELLGTKVRDRPIRLSETVNIFTLVKIQ